MNSLSAYLSPETAVLLISFVATTLYCNWLVNIAEKQRTANK